MNKYFPFIIRLILFFGGYYFAYKYNPELLNIFLFTVVTVILLEILEKLDKK